MVPAREPYASRLAYYKSLRFEHGAPQRSIFFRRDVMEKDPAVIEQVMAETRRTASRMHAYDFSSDDVERMVDFTCDRYCKYQELCALELFGGDTRNLRKQRYSVTDPIYY
jgi:hypothetical protein